MHDCPCCSHAVYADNNKELCDECIMHGCEAAHDGVFYHCDVPDDEDAERPDDE